MESEAAETVPQSERICKICHSACNEASPYAHPCKCKGSLKFIHVECLNEWLKLTKTKKCDICNYPFKFEKKFKIGTPKNVPFYYILLFALKAVFHGVVNVLCFLYSSLKFLLVFVFNSAVCQKYVHSTTSFHSSFFISLLFTLVNLLHSMLISKALKCISSFRARMQSSIVLQNLVADISSRSADDTAVSVRSQVAQDESGSDETDEQILEPFSATLEINLNDLFFRSPTIANIKSDAKIIGHLCIFSAIYPFVYYFSSIFRSMLALVDSKTGLSGKVYRLAPKVFGFISAICIKAFFLRMTGVVAFFALLISILYYLKITTSPQAIKSVYYLVKWYFVTIVSSFFVICTVGVLSHFSFSAAFNNGMPIFAFSQPWFSVIVHCILGSIFTYMCRDLKQRIMKKYRPGLILKVFKDESFSCLVDYCCDLTARQFIFRTIANFLVISMLPLSIFCLSRASLDFSFEANDELLSFFYLKSFLLLYRNGSSITKFLSSLFEMIVLALAKAFDAENYLYNKKINVRDRSRLVWAANVRHIDPKYEQILGRINEVIKSREAVCKKDGECIPDQKLPRSFFADGVMRRKAAATEKINGLGSVTDTNSVFEDGTPHSNGTSATLINSLTEMERDYIFARYQITERRIEKYYGQSHDKKFSIFYKPRHFRLFKMLSFILCLASTCLLFNVLFRLSLLLSRLTTLNKSQTKPVLFVYNFCLVLSTASCIPSVFTKTYQQVSKAAINTFLLATYTNCVFPFVGAIIFVIVNASRNVFAEFSNAFIFLNALSTLTSSFFETFFIFSPLSAYTTLYVLRQVVSFLGLKLAVFFCFIAYTKIITFTSMYIPMVFTVIVVMQTVRIARVMLSGSLMENIKDHFFLDNTTVVNYEHNDVE